MSTSKLWRRRNLFSGVGQLLLGRTHMNTLALNLKDLGILLESAAQRGAELAFEKLNQTRLINKTEVLELLGIKSHSTLRKLSSQPGFPRPVRGRFVRSEIEGWLQERGAK